SSPTSTSSSVLVQPPPTSPLFPYTTLFRSLPKAPHETHLDKPHRVVGGSADVVVRLCVRGKLSTPLRAAPPLRRRDERPAHTARSEEHTSELQSLRHLVCRLLLEKKKYSGH